jgi:glutamyl-tRNA synthetase
MAAICQEKIPTLNDIVPYTDFFFVAPERYEEKAVKKQWEKDGTVADMEGILETIESVAPWNHDALKQAYEGLVARTGRPLGHFVHPTRLALTGKSVGPGLFELAELLGKDEALARMRRAIAFIRTTAEARA